jgi:hypothetical protein
VVLAGEEINRENLRSDGFSEDGHAVVVRVDLVKMKFNWKFISVSTTRVRKPYKVIKIKAIVEA